jgi:uncharacterized membrane protein YebE (DUF533 family)
MVDVTSILTSMLSGGQSNSGGGQLGDLLNSVIQGGGAQAQQGQGGGGGLGDILGQLTGGAQQQGGGGGLGDILGQLTGGGGQQTSGMGGLLGGLLSSGALAGIAGALLGGKGGAMAGTVAKLGGVAVLANMALKVLANYKAGGAKPTTMIQLLNTPHDTKQIAEFDANTTATLLLRAMVAAAMADGEISEEENQAIMGQLAAAGITSEQQAFIDGVMQNPVDMLSLAKQVSKDETKAQLYLASAMVIDIDTEAEEDYLANLADAFDFSSKLKSHLDHAAIAAKQAV